VEESSRRRIARYVHVKNWNFLFYCSNIAKSENVMLWRMLSRLETVGLEKSGHHQHLINLISPWYSYKIAELALNNNLLMHSQCSLSEPTCQKLKFSFLLLEYCKIRECYAVANAFTIRNMYSLFLYMKCNSRKINRPKKKKNKE
jgi:hypothetical protein